ncbi:hypothetical protein L596_029559 [Steinernema carpocapsae]|uniref:Cathepsin propeptide inhibitor domain-containing protein n=1 Tax=Steinernema carpocapsae TaxID=34508 RepID=A0A4U5LUZ2_STECR|nr:hypothetical protein L596_029559 [Steinernema carpocapsae]
MDEFEVNPASTMFCLILLILPLAVFSASPLVQNHVQWHSFLVTHNKTYSSQAEYSKRLGIFMENLKFAKERSKIEEGTATFGWNKFSDMTPEEFQKVSISYKSTS